MRVIARLNVGGPAIHTILLSRYLRPEYDTTLVSGVEDEHEGNMLPLAERLDVPVLRIPELGREINLLGDAVSVWKLIRLIRREKPQIVHTHTAKAGLAGRLAAWACHVPVVVHTFHGHVFRGYFGRLKTYAFLTIERLLARISDRILTVNEEQRRELIAFRVAPPAKIGVMLLGLQLNELTASSADPGAMKAKWHIPASSPVVGIVARLVPIKGHELFLDAAAMLHKRLPEVAFVVIGDGARRAELEHYAKEVGGPATFTGWETDLASVYAALDVICLTSFNEGSPVALIEAMAAGKPVVSTAAGGVTDLIDNGINGMLVESRDVAAFSEAIENLLLDHQLASQIGARGRASVYPRYDITRLANDMRRCYRDLLAEKGLAGADTASARLPVS